MKQSKRVRLNNKGASLIFVIISFVFIATLGTIVISAALTNVEMKKISRQSKQTFYSAEQALNEVKVSLTEDVAATIATAYETALGKFSSTDDSTREALFQNTFVDGMKNKLSVDDFNEMLCDRFNQVYLKEMKFNDVTGNGAKAISTNENGKLGFVVAEGKSITITGLKVINYNKGFVTSVSSDIKIAMPSSSLISPLLAVDSKPYINYSIIANQGLWATTSSHVITGGVYAGADGINVSNETNTLSIQNGNVISAGDITIKDKARLNISSSANEIWAKNLVTSQTSKMDQPNIYTELNITGKTFVQDDLVVDAYNSNISLAGEYYGYSRGTTANTNSAITVNMANANLKLDLLTKLSLAGRAYISFNNGYVSYDPDDAVGASAGANQDVQTGESLSVKGSQTAYMVPSNLLAVGHNPVSWSEYTSYYNNGTPMYQISSDDIIFNNESISGEESKLSYYVDLNDPVTCVFYKFGNDANVVYYYLKFKSDRLATTYFKNFNLCYPDKIYNNFPIRKIIINSVPGTYISAGNLITYNDDAKVVKGSNIEYDNTYGTQYNNLSHTLQKNVISSKSVFENVVNVKKVKKDSDNGTLKNIPNGILPDGITQYGVTLVDGNYSLNDMGKQGIIIATGDVDVKYNFTGLIIAGGKVNMLSGANVTCNPSLINMILDANPDLYDYFIDLNKSDDVQEDWGALNIAQLISYENWRKN